MIRKISLGLLLFAHCGSPDVSSPQLEPVQNRSSTVVSPVPAMGGTLLVQRSPHYAWVANPDADAIEIVSIDTGTLIETINLLAGSEPGRMTEDAVGRVHVVLRKAGAVLSVDRPLHRKTITPVCPSPRGIAAGRGVIWIACEGGELVRMGLDGSPPERVADLGRDLRDVVVAPDGRVLVSRFRSAEILTWDGSTAHAEKPLADVAWRMVPSRQGYAMLRQESQRFAYYGNPPVVSTVAFSNAGSCTKRVNGLAIDVAVSATGDVAVASFGQLGASPTVQLQNDSDYCGEGGVGTLTSVGVSGQPIGVAYAEDGRLVVQTRTPSLLVENAPHTRKFTTYPLSTPILDDLGYTLFHSTTYKDIACASCHPEGGEDGRTWTFPTGDRRTQSIRGGVSKTAPFHWVGDVGDMHALAKDVYEERMGGGRLTTAEIEALDRFVDRIPALPAPSTLDPIRVDRGREVFERMKCASCHAGPMMTDNASHVVGTEDPGEDRARAFQTPSLVGVGARAPYMHTGCAKTLRDRFVTPCGGGVAHGGTVPAEDVDDIVQYLESL